MEVISYLSPEHWCIPDAAFAWCSTAVRQNTTSQAFFYLITPPPRTLPVQIFRNMGGYLAISVPFSLTFLRKYRSHTGGHRSLSSFSFPEALQYGYRVYASHVVPMARRGKWPLGSCDWMFGDGVGSGEGSTDMPVEDAGLGGSIRDVMLRNRRVRSYSSLAACADTLLSSFSLLVARLAKPAS